MRYRLLLLTLVAVTACESRARRCDRLRSEAASARGQHLFAEWQRSERDRLLAAGDSASARRYYSADRIHDPAPPRPSERRWAEEHCWQGKAR